MNEDFQHSDRMAASETNGLTSTPAMAVSWDTNLEHTARMSFTRANGSTGNVLVIAPANEEVTNTDRMAARETNRSDQDQNTSILTRDEFLIKGLIPMDDAVPFATIDSCTICLEALQTDIVKLTPCGHRFHVFCIWRVSMPDGSSDRTGSSVTRHQHVLCPLCRTELYCSTGIHANSEVAVESRHLRETRTRNRTRTPFPSVDLTVFREDEVQGPPYRPDHPGRSPIDVRPLGSARREAGSRRAQARPARSTREINTSSDTPRTRGTNTSSDASRTVASSRSSQYTSAALLALFAMLLLSFTF